MKYLGFITLLAIAYFLFSIDKQLREMRFELIYTACNNE